MKEFFLLSAGVTVFVSDEDCDLVAKYSWCVNRDGYLRAHRLGSYRGAPHVYLHKLIADRMGLIGMIDHEDRNTFNCSRDNLRLSTPSQNQANSGSKKTKGAHERPNGKFQAAMESRFI